MKTSKNKSTNNELYIDLLTERDKKGFVKFIDLIIKTRSQAIATGGLCKGEERLDTKEIKKLKKLKKDLKKCRQDLYFTVGTPFLTESL